jgi:hypothetical protein
MKKLLLVLFVLFLLIAPRIAQADSEDTCAWNDPSCVSLKDDGPQEHDRDDCDRDAAGIKGCDRDKDDDDRDDDDRDDDDRKERDKDKEDRRDRDRDSDDRNDDDEGEDRDRDKDDDDDDDDEGEDRDRDKDDDDDDGEDRDDDDDDDDGEDRDRDDDDDDDEGEDRDRDDDDDDDGEDRDRDDDDDDDEGDEPDDDDDDDKDRPKPGACRTIQDGGIYASNGEEITLGYDRWGYNYQAHKFNGWYKNANRQGTPVETGLVRFKMKWNDVYISNKDCDGDGKLDRHYGHDSFYSTRAWLTNHYVWSYVGDDDNVHWVHWYLKMVAQPYAGFDCASIGGTPFNGQFCTVKNVYYDPYGGSQGMSVLINGLVYGSN